mmetsp:Transcript_10035/g.25996  ORF Transcript_10035/g.25996 Transcript_10035/m.25996 type:complete len:269 (-) Transcript_10035:817-1623(-)
MHAVWNAWNALSISRSSWKRLGMSESSRQPWSCSMPTCSRYSRCHAIESSPIFSGGVLASCEIDSSEMSTLYTSVQKRSSISRGTLPSVRSAGPLSALAGRKRRRSISASVGLRASMLASRPRLLMDSFITVSACNARASAQSGPLPARAAFCAAAGTDLISEMPKSCCRPQCSRNSRCQRTSVTCGGAPAFTSSISAAFTSSFPATCLVTCSMMPINLAIGSSPSDWSSAAGWMRRVERSALARAAACCSAILPAWLHVPMNVLSSP